jgi:hypothetical protein
LLVIGVVVLIAALVAVRWVQSDIRSAATETLFGVTPGRAPGESVAEAFARAKATYGELPVVRVFSSALPPPWQYLHRHAGHASVVVSFKAEPSHVLGGRLDSRLLAWFSRAPTDRDTYWIYFHEPEDNVEAGQFSSDEFRRAWEHIADLASSTGNERLEATVALMCYTANPVSEREWQDYVPSPDKVEVLAWDCYNHQWEAGLYADPDRLLGRAQQASRQVGAAWGIAELGSRVAEGDDGAGRAEWLRAVGRYAMEGEARFVTYFDSTVGGDFRLTDPASVDAWRALVTE